MHASPSDSGVGLLPRIVQRATPVAGAAIIFPGVDPGYAALAAEVAAAVEARCGSRPECVRDLDVMPDRSTPLPEGFRRRGCRKLLRKPRARATGIWSSPCTADERGATKCPNKTQ